MSLCLAMCGHVVYAEQATDVLNENIKNLLDKLDISSLENYLKENQNSKIFDYGNSASEIINFLIKGNFNTDYVGYLQQLAHVLGSDILSLLPIFAEMIAISLLSAIVANAEGSVISTTTSKIVRLAAAAGTVLLLSTVLCGVATTCNACLTNIKSQVEAITPILVTLTVLTGGNGSAAIYQPSAVFVCNGAIELISGFVFPATICCSVLNFASKINPDMSFVSVSKLIRSIMKWAIGITVAIFSIFLTVQGSSSSLFDGILFKATKYVLGSSVPIVGGFISGGVDTLTSAGMLIKNSVGLCGIILLLFEIAQPIILLAALSLLLKLVSAIVQPLGENSLCGLFAEIANDVEYFIAGLLMVAFMYALIVMLMINSANAFI